MHYQGDGRVWTQALPPLAAPPPSQGKQTLATETLSPAEGRPASEVVLCSARQVGFKTTKSSG